MAFGAGGTPSRAFTYGAVRQVTSVDIDDNQLAMAPYFPWNRPLLASPRFRLLGNDGRNFLYTSQDRYDLIFNDPGTYVLYRELGTREYLEIARRRLEVDGLLFQKAHTEIITLEAFRREVATFTAVFPDASLWSAGKSIFLLVGWGGAPAQDYQDLVDRAQRLGGRRRAGLSPEHPAARFVLDHDELLALSAGAAPFTDDRIPPMHHLFVLPDVTDLSAAAMGVRRANARGIVEAIRAADTRPVEFFTGIPAGALAGIHGERLRLFEEVDEFLTVGDLGATRTVDRPGPRPPAPGGPE